VHSIKNYYEILRVSPVATAAEIRKAYHQLARQYHPDAHSGKGSNAIFATVNEAYGILSNGEKRKHYHREVYLKHFGHQRHPLNARDVAAKVHRLFSDTTAIAPLQLDRDYLYLQLKALLSGTHLDLLKEDPSTEYDPLCTQLLTLAGLLEYKQAKMLEPELSRLFTADAYRQRIGQLMRQKQVRQWQRRLTFPLVMLAALLMCWLIYRFLRQ
jgi:molecular chaperone DnaJ